MAAVGIRSRPKRRIRRLAGDRRPVRCPEGWLKIALEAAALIGVVTAVIAGSVYSLGTVAYFAYLDALGFDARQFPTLGSQLHVLGTMYGVVLPALFIVSIVLACACVFASSNRAEEWVSRAPAKWRIPLGLVIIAISVGAVYFGPPATLMQWIVSGFIVGIFVSAANLLEKWVVPAAVSIVVSSVVIGHEISYVHGLAYKVGKARAEKAGKSCATTIVELTDGNKITVPGVRIACSERFCGFHDGKTATVISLEEVRSIQSPVPQEQPGQTSDK